MERFKESDIICDKADVDHQVDITNEAFKFAAEIRQILEKKGYLLETYLSYFLDGASEICTEVYWEIVNEFPPDYNLKSLINLAMNGETDKHPFYETVKTYIDTHPLKYQEEGTRHTLYAVALFGDYFKYRSDEQREILSKKLDEVLGIMDLDSLQTEIDEIIGPEPMKKLNLLLHQAFLSVAPMSVCMQNMTGALMEDLVYRDKETSRTVVGLWLDNLSG